MLHMLQPDFYKQQAIEGIIRELCQVGWGDINASNAEEKQISKGSQAFAEPSKVCASRIPVISSRTPRETFREENGNYDS
jgi:hypothetical protein